MIVQQRSWFETPRWWLRWAVTALALFAVTWLTTAALGDDPREDVVARALLAACVSVGTLVGARRDYRRRQELQKDADGEFEEMVAAERVVRRGAVPTSERQRRLAVRIADLRRREVGGRWAPWLLSAVGAAVVILGLTLSPWWLPLGVAAGLLAATAHVESSRLTRRRAALDAVTT